jgi:hypothetical protein
MEPFALVVLITVVALILDFIHGFHDAASSTATVVSTRVLRPTQAVVWAAVLNFVAAFGFGVNVARRYLGAGFHVPFRVVLAPDFDTARHLRASSPRVSTRQCEGRPGQTGRNA